MDKKLVFTLCPGACRPCSVNVFVCAHLFVCVCVCVMILTVECRDARLASVCAYVRGFSVIC